MKRAQDALVALVSHEVPVLQRHAIEALTRIGMPKRLAPKLFASLTSHVADVRDAARAAITSFGEEIVPTIRERIPHAEPAERKALDSILAELGGKDAFSTLLAGLASTVGEEAKQAAIAMRAHVKNAGARERRSYLSECEKFLAKQTKANAAATVVAAVIKIMGYLEDEHATETLLAYASDAKQPPAVRQEALIALRFALGQKKADEKKVVAALLDAAEADDCTLAHTALHTLGSMQLPTGLSKRVEKLMTHADFERARFVLEMLGRQGDADAVKTLVHAATTLEKKRAEVAAAALAGKDEAIAPLAKAILETKDVDRAWLLKNVLRPSAKKIPTALRKQILEAAIARLGDGERGWEALLDVARDADADGVATELRALAQKLRKKGDEKARAVYTLLCRSDRATDDDRYALASIELARGGKDTRFRHSPRRRVAQDALAARAHRLRCGERAAQGPEPRARRALLRRFPLRRGEVAARRGAARGRGEEGGPHQGRQDGEEQAGAPARERSERRRRLSARGQIFPTRSSPGFSVFAPGFQRAGQTSPGCAATNCAAWIFRTSSEASRPMPPSTTSTIFTSPSGLTTNVPRFASPSSSMYTPNARESCPSDRRAWGTRSA